MLHGGDCSASPIVRSRQTKNILSGRRRIARMLGAVAVMFAICWMPYQLLRLARNNRVFSRCESELGKEVRPS